MQKLKKDTLLSRNKDARCVVRAFMGTLIASGVPQKLILAGASLHERTNSAQLIDLH